MGFRIGIDTGGTFTDAISLDDNGVTQTAKSFSKPGNLIIGAANVVVGLAKRNGMSRKDFLSQVMSIYIRRILKIANGKINGPGGAAELLGVHPNTLRKRMVKLGIPYGLGRKVNEVL